MNGIKLHNGKSFLILALRFYFLQRYFQKLYSRQIRPLFSEIYSILPQDQAKRLQYRVKYYTSSLAPFFGSLLYQLHGLHPNKEQKKLLALAGASTAFFDMIYDENWLKEQLIVFPPPETSNPIGRLIHQLYHLIMQTAPMPDGLLYWINRISLIELESCTQKGKPSKEEIERITFDKGGAGLMVFRQLVPIAPTKDEENALMIVGATIQLMDDMADVWQDIQERITTPAIFYKTPANFAQHIENQFKNIYAALSNAGFNHKKTTEFCFTLYAAFLVGKIHAYQLTRYLESTGKSLTSLTKSEVILKPDLSFGLRYLRQILKFNLD